jgi:hypothetical protein
METQSRIDAYQTPSAAPSSAGVTHQPQPTLPLRISDLESATSPEISSNDSFAWHGTRLIDVVASLMKRRSRVTLMLTGGVEVEGTIAEATSEIISFAKHCHRKGVESQLIIPLSSILYVQIGMNAGTSSD